MKNRLLLTIILLCAFVSSALAQDVSVEGAVTDAVTGAELPGVNVVIQGTSTGTTTGMDGTYALDVDGPGTVLVFSYVGYETQTVSITQSHINEGLNVELQEDVALLEELVVVGFGTQERADVTGAVSSIQGREVEARPLTNPALALQGVTPGLQIQYGGGQPGEENTIARIRGTGTLNNADPLVLVDGVEQSLSTVEPNSIESISVLKDAASASIYGSRAANGVILIETKRGQRSGMAITYNNHIGWQNLLGWPESAGKEDWMRLENEAQVNAGGQPTYSEEYIQNVVAGTNPLQYPWAEWEKGVFQDNAFDQNHALSVSTGSDFGRIYASMN